MRGVGSESWKHTRRKSKRTRRKTSWIRDCVRGCKVAGYLYDVILDGRPVTMGGERVTYLRSA